MGLRLVDLNIGTRMLMGFALVLLLLVLALAAGIARLSAFNDSFEQLADHRVPNMAAAQDWQRYLQDSGLKMRNMLILTNPSEIRAQVEIVREDQKKRGELVEGLTRTIVLAGGKEKLADALKAREAYGSLEQKFLELVEAGDIANAKTFLLDSVRPAQLANIDAIGKLVDFEKESVHQSREAAVQAYQSSRNLLLVLGLIAMGVGIAAALLITRGILAQLGGEPAEAARIAGKIAEGELDVRIALKQGDRSSLLFAIEAMRAKLLQIVDDVRQGALQVSEGTIQISRGNDDLSRRTQEQAAAIEETASSMEEMTATVKQNADNANAASGLATNAREQAESGGKVVNDAVAAMAEISSSSRRIADIIVVIDEIAFQTNLLALNAAVEAARAGEQGRGFAVVASEVRNLAQRSAGAAREIKTLIQDSVEKVRTGTELVDASGATLIEIVASVKKVAEIVQEIVSASKQQASGIDQINHAVTQMDSVIQQNAALVEEAAAASKSIEGEAASLQQRVSFFRTGRTHANTHATPAPAPAVRTVKPAPQRIPARPRKVAGGENTWEDF